MTCCVWLCGCVCDQEERLAAARVALGDLAALVGMLVRESGAKYLGENVGDELLDLLGLDDVAVAVRCPLRAFSHGASWPASLTMLCLCLCLCLWLWRTCARLQDTPDDAEAKGAEGTVDADAEGESKDGAAGGESKAAGDAGESKGEASDAGIVGRFSNRLVSSARNSRGISRGGRTPPSPSCQSSEYVPLLATPRVRTSKRARGREDLYRKPKMTETHFERQS